MKANDKIQTIIKKYNLPDSALSDLQQLHLDGMLQGAKINKL